MVGTDAGHGYAGQVGAVHEVTDLEDAKDAILELACSACAIWAVYANGQPQLDEAMNRLTNAIFVYNQGLADPVDIVAYCTEYVQAHKRRIGAT
jgi:hypothetical protein